MIRGRVSLPDSAHFVPARRTSVLGELGFDLSQTIWEFGSGVYWKSKAGCHLSNIVAKQVTAEAIRSNLKHLYDHIYRHDTCTILFLKMLLRLLTTLSSNHKSHIVCHVFVVY